MDGWTFTFTGIVREWGEVTLFAVAVIVRA
jgi:hypothetical protein